MLQLACTYTLAGLFLDYLRASNYPNDAGLTPRLAGRGVSCRCNDGEEGRDLPALLSRPIALHERQSARRRPPLQRQNLR